MPPCRFRASRWARSEPSNSTGRGCWSSSRSTRTFGSVTAPRPRSRPRVCWAPRSSRSPRAVTGSCDGTIPLDRTTSPYQLPDALGDLATTISGLNTDQLSDSLRVLVADLRRHPARAEDRGRGRGPVLARRSTSATPSCATCSTNANKATTVLAERSDQVVSLIANTNALLAELRKPKRRTGSDLGQHLGAQPAAAGLHRREPRHAEARAGQAQRRADDHRQPQGAPAEVASNCSTPYAMSLGESVASGPFFKSYVANLLPGQFVQPFIDAAFSDLGLDPNVLLPSRAHRPADRPARHPGVAGALPAHRPGRRTASDPARRDHRQPGRSGVRSARLAAARPDWLLPLPRAAARAAARRSAAGSACAGAARAGLHTGADAEPGHTARTG